MTVALSTWSHGIEPNRLSYEILSRGGAALDAVEVGAKYSEADLTCMSVGRGALPDAEGKLTLDASIMNYDGSCGSVAFVQHYLHVITLARRVMEKTPHVMLAGEGAEAFAVSEGFPREELLTDKARALYEQWKAHPNKLNIRLRRAHEGEHEYTFEEVDQSGTVRELRREDVVMKVAKNESHDTIGLLALDSSGRLAGACTTSGLAFKMHGRVGDSPIVGAGLYVDGEVAAAVATGNGELMMRACSAFHIVEMVRQGIEPGEACERALAKIRKDKSLTDDMQAGLMVIRKDGVWSARGLRPGFQFVANSNSLARNTLYDCTPNGYTIAENR
jgi:N4-(beta-N-acetylglucosaminyl)-L-asparaginase